DVENATSRSFKAIQSLHDLFFRPLTAEAKEVEKRWVKNHLGFCVLFAQPGLHGKAYYNRQENYGLNVHICNTPSNVRIMNYSHSFTGSSHDAVAFEHTATAWHPLWFTPASLHRDNARSHGIFSAAHPGAEETEDKGEAHEPIDDD
ncbi:hypothetical protein BDR06DRAFT_978219, partial [Suillus hirtellus]